MSKLEFRVSPQNNQLLARLCGQFDEHLKQIENRLGVKVSNRGDLFSIDGESDASNSAKILIEHLYKMTENETLTPEEVHLSLQESGLEAMQAKAAGVPRNDLIIKTRKSMIQCRGSRQIEYVRSIKDRDLTFGIGPAGTGKCHCRGRARHARTLSAGTGGRPGGPWNGSGRRRCIAARA